MSDERIQGPVDSAITQLLQHFEVAMWARGVPPDTALEVLNLILFGTHTGGPAGRTESIPGWAEAYAMGRLMEIRTDLTESPGPEGRPVEDDLKLVVLALVRQVLQGSYGPIEQALNDAGSIPNRQKDR